MCQSYTCGSYVCAKWRGSDGLCGSGNFKWEFYACLKWNMGMDCMSKLYVQNVCAKWRGSDGLCGSGSNPAAQGGLRPPAATLVPAPETNRIAWCRLLHLQEIGGRSKRLSSISEHKNLGTQVSEHKMWVGGCHNIMEIECFSWSLCVCMCVLSLSSSVCYGNQVFFWSWLPPLFHGNCCSRLFN